MKKVIFGVIVLLSIVCATGMFRAHIIPAEPTLNDIQVSKLENLYLDVVLECWEETRIDSLTATLETRGIEPYSNAWLLGVVRAYYEEGFGITPAWSEEENNWITFE